MSNTGNNIKRLRLQSGMTLLELANKLGVKEATAQRYESGAIKNVKYDTLIKMSEIFNVKPSEILGWEEPQPVGVDFLKQFIDVVSTMSDEEKADLKNYMNFIISKRR